MASLRLWNYRRIMVRKLSWRGIGDEHYVSRGGDFAYSGPLGGTGWYFLLILFMCWGKVPRVGYEDENMQIISYIVNLHILWTI